MKIHKLSRGKSSTIRWISDKNLAGYLKSKLTLRIKSDTYTKSSKVNMGK